MYINQYCLEMVQLRKNVRKCLYAHVYNSPLYELAILSIACTISEHFMKIFYWWSWWTECSKRTQGQVNEFYHYYCYDYNNNNNHKNDLIAFPHCGSSVLQIWNIITTNFSQLFTLFYIHILTTLVVIYAINVVRC